MKGVLVIVAGVLMILSSVAHAVLGWAAMRQELQAAGAPLGLVGGLSVGWHFGSVAMATFGLILILCGSRLRRHDRSALAPVRVIAAAYVLFGLAAYFARHFNSHFLIFVALGALAGLPVLSRGPAPVD